MTIFYIIWFVFFFLSLVCLSALIYVFVLSLSTFIYVFVFSCCLHLSNSDPLTQWIPLPTLLIKTFLNFYPFFFPVTCPLPNSTCPYYAQLLVNKEKTISTNSTLFYSLYLSYLYNTRERVTNTESQSQSQNAQKKKNTTGRINF